MNSKKDPIFVNGIKFFKPKVDFVKLSMSFSKDQFYLWYTDKMNDDSLWTPLLRKNKDGEEILDKNGKQQFDDYMNIQVKENKNGVLYADVNTWKKEEKSNNQKYADVVTDEIRVPEQDPREEEIPISAYNKTTEW